MMWVLVLIFFMSVSLGKGGQGKASNRLNNAKAG